MRNKLWLLTLVTLLALSGIFSDSAGGEVIINLGDDWQKIIDANPAGTIYRVAAGTHRLQAIRPKSGDMIVGGYGAVMKGSILLDPANAKKKDGVWIFDVVNVPMIAYTAGTKDNSGKPLKRSVWISNDLYINNNLMKHVESRGEVNSPGTYFMDYDLKELVIFDNPAQ